ncbi:MAG: flagellar M-ring protein FliF, partial [Alphaproteobacteria bacterium]|nr:flagellar M-ring protein FliF [Alphaproteobacteria bacterium]
MFLAVLLVARSASQRDLTLLFGGLDPAAAGEVITALDQRGAIYEVRGGAIYVESNQRDLLRMSLAGEGLPAIGAQGYELLDGLSGFGTTSQMFDATYWRAREGEL